MARHGENIRKRADGRWEGRYKAYDESIGKDRYRSVYGHTYDEVKQKLSVKKNLLQEEGQEEYRKEKSGSGIIFSRAAGEWLKYVKERQKYSTYVKYSTIYECHLAEVLGPCRLSEIERESDMTKNFDNLSISMQKSVYCVANQILRYANGRYNLCIPMLERMSIKTDRKSVETFSKQEQAKLFSSLYQGMDKYKISVLLCLYTGLRLGELCALQWDDIDERNLTLSVNRTVQRIAVENMKKKSILMETPPKSDTAKRLIPVSDEVMEILMVQRDSRPYVFGGEKPMEPRTMQYRFQKILEEAGLSGRKFHILRHTFATNCIENSVDVKSLSEILGHSSVKITLNCYVHPTMDLKREQIGKLSGFYGQICGQS